MLENTPELSVCVTAESNRINHLYSFPKILLFSICR